jgi:hypothetical protein
MRPMVLACAATLALTVTAVAPRCAMALPNGVDPALQVAALAQAKPVRYVCGPYRCYWQPNVYYRPYYFRPAPFYYRPYPYRRRWVCGPYRCWRRW